MLTDGSLLYSETGETFKRFNTLDGHGLKLLQKAGITPVIITGRDSQALRARLTGAGRDACAFRAEEHKVDAAQESLRALGLQWNQAAAMGDDWPDLPVMQRCAFSCAPAGAHVEVLRRADHVTTAQGGHGAAREFCDILMVASGRYANLLQEYLS